MFILVPDRPLSGRYQATQLLSPGFHLLVGVFPYESRILPRSCFINCNICGKRTEIGVARVRLVSRVEEGIDAGCTHKNSREYVEGRRLYRLSAEDKDEKN